MRRRRHRRAERSICVTVTSDLLDLDGKPPLCLKPPAPTPTCCANASCSPTERGPLHGIRARARIRTSLTRITPLSGHPVCRRPTHRGAGQAPGVKVELPTEERPSPLGPGLLGLSWDGSRRDVKQYRAIATRYDKTALSYQGIIDLATLLVWL